jgi:hypothetical protein
MAMMLVLETRSPTERAVFVLREACVERPTDPIRNAVEIFSV